MVNVIEKYDRQFQYAGILFHLLIALQFYLLWSQPQLDQAPRIIEMATLMAFEFIMVHSGIAMAFAPKKYALFVLFPVYGIFALAFSASIKGHLILIIYLVTILNRMRFAFADVPKPIKIRTIVTSVVAVFIYFFLVMFVSGLDTKIPVLGLTSGFLKNSNYFEVLDGTTGMFMEMPQTALCLGVLYYLSLAIFEFSTMNKPFKRIGNFIAPF